MSEKEKKVFNQEVSTEELSMVSGGVSYGELDDIREEMDWDCIDNNKRDIYKGGFPNCAATVEDASWCGTNDACVGISVDYRKMNDCGKAWR